MDQLSKPTYESLEQTVDQFRADRRRLRDALELAATALRGVLDADLVPTGRTVKSAFEHAAQTLTAIQ